MKFQIPKTTFTGKPVAGSLERVLAGLNANPATNPPAQPPVNAPNLDDYIFVPSIGLYVAKQRTHPGLNWFQTHEELHKENLRMPTIYEFKEFLKYLRQNQNGLNDASSQEITTIIDDILTVRNPWRAEWLDAKFEKRAKGIYIIEKNDPNTIQPLEKCLMKDKGPGIDLEDWLNNSTKQGLPNPKAKKGQLYYWYPRDTAVARFNADSDRAYLYCDWYPTNLDASLGVFACAEGAR